MAFGADDVQAAERDDLIVLGATLVVEALVDVLPGRRRHTVEVVQMTEVDELLVVYVLLFAARHLLGDFFGEALLARHVLGVAAEQDVGTAAGHVGGHRDLAEATRLRDNLGFLRVVLGVQHDVLHTLALEHRREQFRFLDRDGAHEHRTPLGLLLRDVLDDGVVLFALRAEDRVGFLDADQGPVGRHLNHVELVDLVELLGLGVGRAGHARQLLVLAEEVLEGDRGERLVLALDLHAFLGLDGLMQTIAPATARHHAAGVLVDDDHFAGLVHEVLDVATEQRVGPQSLLHVVEQGHVGRVVQAARQQPMRQQLLGVRHAAFGERGGLVLLVDDVVAGCFEGLALLGLDLPLDHRARLELGDDPIDLVVQVGGLLGRPGDDQRRARLVDEDAVDFVDDGEEVPALQDHLREIELHVVAQVIEAELVVGAVGDVGAVLTLPLVVTQVVLDDADRHVEEAVDAAHPLRVAPRQVVVHRDDVHALARQRVQVRRQRRDERLALAGLHLGDAAAVQDDAANQLDVVVAHVHHATAGLADDRESLGQQIVERLSLREPLPELGGLGAQLGVAQLLHGWLELVDASHERLDPLQLAFVLRADDLGEKGVENQRVTTRWRTRKRAPRSFDCREGGRARQPCQAAPGSASAAM